MLDEGIFTFLMTVSVGHDDGFEYASGFLVLDVVAFEHLSDGGVFFGDDGVVFEVGREVEIAHHPTVVSGLLLIGEGNSEYVFGCLLDLVACLFGFVKGGSVRERMLQVESEFFSVVSYSAPASLGEFTPVDFERDGFLFDCFAGKVVGD